MKKTIGDEKSEFEAVFRIFSNKGRKWETFRKVKFETLAQLLSILTLSINCLTENIIDTIEQLQSSGKVRRKRLKNLEQKKHT